MSRIIAGRGKGRRLRSPRGRGTRPTGSRVRQTLFDVLATRVAGCRFLDLFAGAGGVGLEALSRGAARVVLVERDAAAVDAIRDNRRALAAAGGDVQVFRQDARVALLALADAGARFDLIYLDPPYESDLYEPILALVGASGMLEADGLLVAEHFHKRALPPSAGTLALTRSVRVGDHRLTFYRRQEG